jgi:hypothetical protein
LELDPSNAALHAEFATNLYFATCCDDYYSLVIANEIAIALQHDPQNEVALALLSNIQNNDPDFVLPTPGTFPRFMPSLTATIHFYSYKDADINTTPHLHSQDYAGNWNGRHTNA